MKEKKATDSALAGEQGEKSEKMKVEDRERRRKRDEVGEAEKHAEESSSEEEDDGDEIQFKARTKEELIRQGEDDDEDEEEDTDLTETVRASFGLFDPHEEAAEAVLALLRHARLDVLLKTPSGSLRALAETIANQGNVGSVLKAVPEDEDDSGKKDGAEQDDDAPVVGFLSLLSLRQYPEATDVFKDALLRLAADHAPAGMKAKLEAVLAPESDETAGKEGAGRKHEVNCGWMLKERVNNTPPALIPTMFASLLEDIAWSLATEEMDEEERPFYKYTHVVALTKVYKEADAGPTAGPKKAKGDEPLGFKAFFPHPEDEELLKVATSYFTCPTGSSARISAVEDGGSAVSEGNRKKNVSPEAADDDTNMEACGQIRSCPEYLLLLLLPFDKLKNCTDAMQRQALLQAAS
ncbi:hypothetical protein NCLIV_045000 [Neospora caninum Liverpool]|uniref:P21-carboxy-terminal region-binding protein n=1 Tax=Neospora caninum (strain Liverpool) TaxID=572307 RepID=F0VLD8_NEOCL|nr:hypothetical protein NCLIV_045000 [Neospora caninum Liverpool]CBZ54066.1 hypothetical protein NCLIV_045000 [Neospora caninum Liverpool]CEL68762.1 TPA: hypothetical protein BN1204_045000 [Neospora caninum Liverpool]|eukprot:XP_003884097.1 hypothetical protein NCLIV_045000 [Neospora caninum Liverpool]